MRFYERAALLLATGVAMATLYPDVAGPDYDLAAAGQEATTPDSTLDTQSTAEAAVTAVLNDVGIADSPEDYRTLLQNDAPLHYVVVPATESAPTDPGDTNATSFDVLRAEDPFYLGLIVGGVRNATYGTYEPRGITVAEAPVFTTAEGCINGNDELVNTSLHELAKPHEEAGAINIIVTELPNCDDGYLGYSATGAVPVLNDAPKNKIVYATGHEFGHSGRLGHAGTIACTDVVLLIGCAPPNETGDRTSIMGYLTLPSYMGYSAAELSNIGLMPKDEVIEDPEPGLYLLSALDTVAEESGTRLLQLDTGHGTLSFSWELDPQASFDVHCLPYGAGGKDPAAYNGFDVVTGGVLQNCYQGNWRFESRTLKTHLQADDSPSNNILLRPDRSDPAFPSYGEVIPGAVLYQDPDSGKKFTYMGFTPDNKGIVLVEAA